MQNALQIALKVNFAHRSFGHPWSDALRMTAIFGGNFDGDSLIIGWRRKPPRSRNAGYNYKPQVHGKLS